MAKRERCNICGGCGVVIPKIHGGMVVPKKCEHCEGTGQIDVPITNADHIRSMTDDELTTLLCDISDCNRCRWGQSSGCTVREWLKQPYDGERKDNERKAD